MKKKFLLGSIVLASVLVGCSRYSSKKQAMDACNEWEAKGEDIRYKFLGDDGLTYEHYNRNRACFNAYWDKHVIGYYGEFNDDDRAKEGKVLNESDKPQPQGTNKKYFRY